jgi:4-amino-4-deoxy-L-arabinose transferase-like glycosyltransferase
MPGGTAQGQPSGNGMPGFPGGLGGSQVDQQLLSYLEKNQGKAKYLLAVPSSMAADPYIIATGKPVMALGGFSGSDKILTVAQLATLVKNGTVRFFLLSGGGIDLNSAIPAAALEQMPAQIRTELEEGKVPFGGGPGGGMGGDVNAGLTSWVTANCATVSSSAYSSSGAGGGQLYDCAAKASGAH